MSQDDESPATPPSPVARNDNGSSTSALTPSHEQIPYYLVEDGKLVKGGRSCKGGTYRHRVPRDHFEVIVRKLATIAHQGEFETEELTEQCGVPRHEPLIVLDMLRKQGFLNKVRRGRWRVVNAATVRQDAESAWDRLARDSGR